ncbi:hypothetical protein GOODEAATRI_002603 [Goodea atripinnis]|uniref:Trans-1,2-dihydrobenzene-1,2-diol dehydrogenase n=1 Tax=Goodea atripinnis TaxID=208336 RepID=A0ABV0N7C0_9TELE
MATRWGICSAGKISHDFTVALKTLPAEDHQVVAVAARKLEDAQEFARKHSISRAYGSYEELARDPEIDVVYVGVIHPYHLNACRLFTNAKKNVLCEKPLAMNTKEVKEILDCAKKNDVFLMEVNREHTRKKLLAHGEIGEVKMVRTDFGVPLLHVPRSVQKDLGGGALLDLGIYCLQFISMVYNGERPQSVQASGVCLETGVDETVVVMLRFSRNRMAVFTCSAGMQLPNDAIIAGTKGTIRVGHQFVTVLSDGKLEVCSGIGLTLVHCTCTRSFLLCGPQHRWLLMGRRPSTRCLNPTCLSTFPTAQGCATKHRRSGSVCSKV